MISTEPTACGVCGAGDLETVLDLGPQPVSSHFTVQPGQTVCEHPLALSVCGHCGAVQLARPFPFRDLVPPYDWITYREPEGHLDAVVEKLIALPTMTAGSRILGLSFKDRSTLDRLRSKGFQNTQLLDLYADLGANYPNANIESVSGLLTKEKARSLLRRRGPADTLIARHVLEHAQSLRGFFAALAELVRPEGFLILEVPECSGNLQRQDYTMIWEEHAHYFNARTIRHAVTMAGFSVMALEVCHYPFEDVVVVYARKGALQPDPIEPACVARDVAAARAYGAAFPTWTVRYNELCGRLTSGGRALAAYGAGHLTCAFLHFHGLSRHFAFIVDDTPQKQNLFLPKSGLPIVGRDILTAKTIAACLFGVGPGTENNVIAENRTYLENGGMFYSMLADSERTVRRLI